MAAPGSTNASPWPALLLLYAAGLMAAAQLGKMSALVPVISPPLGLSLGSAAWVVSLLEVGGATLGAVAGGLALRLGLWRSLQLGLAALAVAGLGSATAQGAPSLMAWRLLEAAGYLGITVSAPVLMARLTAGPGAPRAQMLAMTLWSTFVPVGVALGASGAAAAALPWGWRGTLLAGGLLAAALAAATRALAPAAASEERAPAGQAAAAAGKAAWCLALGFGLFALFAVGVIALLPSLLVDGAGLSPAAAGQWTGLSSLSAVVGSALGAWLQRHGVALRWPALLALALPAPMVWGVFSAAPQAGLAVGLAIAINVLGGVWASLAFSALPRVVASPAQLVRANGLITQFGASGSLLGPPVMAAGIGQFGWPGGAAVATAVALLSLPFAWRAMRRL
jgi:hypothetical protein